MIIISTFFSNFNNVCIRICFVTKLLISGILFSTAVNGEVDSDLPVLYLVFKTKPTSINIIYFCS